MLDLNKPVQTRDGRTARFLFRKKHLEYPLVFIITNSDGEEIVSAHTEDGSHREVSTRDIINKPEPEFDINKPFRTRRGFPARLVGSLDVVSEGSSDHLEYIVAVRIGLSKHETAFQYQANGKKPNSDASGMTLVNT